MDEILIVSPNTEYIIKSFFPLLAISFFSFIYYYYFTDRVLDALFVNIWYFDGRQTFRTSTGRYKEKRRFFFSVFLWKKIILHWQPSRTVSLRFKLSVF